MLDTMGWHSFFRVGKWFSYSLPSGSKHFHKALSPLVRDYSCQPQSFYSSKRVLNKGLPLEYRFTLLFRSFDTSLFEGNDKYGQILHSSISGRFRWNARMMSGVNGGQDAESIHRGEKLEVKVRRSAAQKSQATFMYLVAVVVGMVGVTYASVPLYRKFCQATGYGGTVQRRETVEEKIARHRQEDPILARELVVQFNADVADGMPWRFTPCQREVRVKPGQSTLAFYTAENRSSEPITGVSTYNVTPMKAGIYFNKIQCFCFEEQRLLPGEKLDMPVFFYIDPEFITDPKMNGINNLILSYTFFKVEDGKD